MKNCSFAVIGGLGLGVAVTATLVAAAVLGDGGAYRVASVAGKLLQIGPGAERRLAVGELLAAGSELRTGWFSTAELEHDAAAATFHLGARARGRLADQPPGVLLQVERGRVRAAFHQLLGDAPVERLVTTPSAVLAVRGTEYGVAVAADGSTEVVVFAGVVEVADAGRVFAPVAVPAGQGCRVDRGLGPTAPMPHGMSRDGFDRGTQHGPGADAGRAGGGHPGQDGPGGGSMPHGGPGGGR